MATTATSPQVEIGPKERFLRYFQHEVTALQEQMHRLADTALAGGERADAIDHCLAGISHLSDEVRDASVYLPAYDQLKALSEKLMETRSTLAPKSRFAFKTARKNASAISLNDAAEIASQQRLRMTGYSSNRSSAESSMSTTPNYIPTPPSEPNDSSPRLGVKGPGNKLLSPQTAAVRKPSFSESTSVMISNHTSVHIILPSSASHATSSGSLTSLRRCVVDMSVSTASGQPLAGLTLKNIRDSLLVCGHVNGPTHVTGVENSVIVVACRQFRMHECRGCDVYLLCASRPIIEGCNDIRFAPLPELYKIAAEKPTENQWDRVDDFKWLKAEHSPNWSVLPSEERIHDEVWKHTVPGGPDLALDDILKSTVPDRPNA
ncbi:MAG: hypothetical protein M1812_004722 [Candelaria pacifica]|nr:MAG: hypothetical protein M1812_004722 [Candelaria pacifica]